MQSFAAVLFLTLPWLNPFSPGPTPAVIPWLVSVACFALFLLEAPRLDVARVAPTAWLAAALLSSAIGLLQYFGAADALSPWVNQTAVGEAYANLRQRNQFATLINLGMAALLWGFGRRAGPGTVWPLAGAVLLSVGNAASSSRTGLVQLLVLAALASLWQRRSQARCPAAQHALLGIALLSYAVAAMALPLLAGLDPLTSGILARLHDGGPNCSNRLTLWSNVLHLIAQKPWSGWGWSELDYAHFITLYPGPRFCEILDNAHNLPLHLAVELGLPLAIVTCVGLGWAVWRARPWDEVDPARRMAWAVLGVIAVHSLLEYPLWYGPFQIALVLCLWLLWRRGRAPSEPFLRFARWAPYLSVFTASVLLAFALYSGVDYRRISQLYLDPPQRLQAYRVNTLEKVSDSRLFRDPVNFAKLTITDLTLDNAADIHALAAEMLHFSPEPRVIEKLIESATLLGYPDEALFYLQRYQAAFALAHAQWAQENAKPMDAKAQDLPRLDRPDMAAQ